ISMCELHNITLNNHHDALEVSGACAELLLQQEQRFGVEPLKKLVLVK
ncbi:3'-5' exonuclease, partial [Enterococcus faecalis]